MENYANINLDNLTTTTKTKKINSNLDTKDIKDCVLRVSMAGHVNAGKTTFISVLTSVNGLDNGKGNARDAIVSLPHELKSQRTSQVTFYPLIFKQNEKYTKIAHLIDVAGHEKYLRTSLFSFSGTFSDYAIVLVEAGGGIKKMTREHLGILLYLKIPIIILLTKIDACPPHMYETTIAQLKKIFTSSECRRTLYATEKPFCKGAKDEKEEKIILKEKHDDTYLKVLFPLISDIDAFDRIIPVIGISNTTGYNIDLVKKLIYVLKPRQHWSINKEFPNDSSMFYIDKCFWVNGIGVVVSGTDRGATLIANKQMYVGPHNGKFIAVKIKTLHNNTRDYVNEISNGNSGCLSLAMIDKDKFLTKSDIKKGMILVSDKSFEKNICSRFKANIKILHHSSTIKNNYQAVVHCLTVRQTAKLILDKEVILRTGLECNATMEFIVHPEFLEVGNTIFLREGSTRACGTITEIIG